MATSTGTIVFYDKALLAMFAGMNWNSASTTFTMGLATSAYTPNVASQTIYSNITGQHSTTFGYTQPGLTLSSTLFSTTGTAGTLAGKWDFNDPAWTANGGSIVARYYFIYTPTTVLGVANSLIAYGLLDSTAGGTDVTTTDTNTLTINIDTNGFFTSTIS